MTRSTGASAAITALILASLLLASCMTTVVRRLECQYDEAAAAAAGEKASGHRGAVRSIAFTHDGTRIVSAGQGGRVLLWDLNTGASREIVPQRDGPVSLAFAENQQALVLAVRGQADLGLFDLRRGEGRASVPGGFAGGLRPFAGHAFSRDGALLAVPRAAGGITLWNIKVGQAEVELAGAGSGINDLCFSADDELLATAAEDGSVRILSVADGDEALKFEPHGGAPVTALALTGDGGRIATASADGEVVISEAATGARALVLEGCDAADGEMLALEFSPSGKALFGVEREGCDVQFVCVWDAESGDAVAAFEVPVTDAIDFSADGSTMATGGCGCEIILWDLEAGAPVGQLGASCRLEVEGGCD